MSVGASLLQKSARESGEVAEIEICARIIRQVKLMVSHQLDLFIATLGQNN